MKNSQMGTRGIFRKVSGEYLEDLQKNFLRNFRRNLKKKKSKEVLKILLDGFKEEKNQVHSLSLALKK